MFVIEKVNHIVKRVCKEFNVNMEEDQNYIDEIIWSNFRDLEDDLVDFDLEKPLKDQMNCFFESLETELRNNLKN